MCFDTTASNTGNQNGACVLLEDKLNRKLLHLACRHHILELLVSKLFEILVEKNTRGPIIDIFQKF